MRTLLINARQPVGHFVMPKVRYAPPASLLAAITLLLFSTETVFAAPTIQSISLRGVQAGGETRLVIAGAELLPNPRLIIDAPVSEFRVLPSSKPNRLEAVVRIPADAPRGVRRLRIATDGGVSNAIVVSVDALPQIGFAERIESLPIAMTGSVSGSQILKSTFTGKKGQRVAVEVESQRLGAALKPVVRLLDSRGRQLAFASGNASLSGDARCEATLPEDGEYVAVLHDVLYRGANPGHFRMTVGDLAYAPHTLPLAAQSGKVSDLELIGGDAGKASLDASQAAAGDQLSVPFAANQKISTGQRILISDSPELVEHPNEAGVTVLPSVPVGVSGRIGVKGEEDRFEIPTKPGSRLRIQVFAERLGSELDGVLIVRGVKGNQLARNDDQNSTTDPMLDYTVPKGVDKLVLAIQDLQQRGGEDFVYRLSIEDLAAPDFQLSFDQDVVNIPAGGARILRVDATRRAYNGPIHLMLPGLPEHVSVTGNVISAGSNFTLLTMTSTKPGSFGTTTQVVGVDGGSPPTIRRFARHKTPAADAQRQPWLARSLAAGAAPADAIRVSWADGADPFTTFLGGKHPLKIKLDRAEGAVGDVRIKILATQDVPKKKIKQNNKEVVVDDLDRALRLAENVLVKADASDVQVVLLTPADLQDRNWNVIVAAELLSPQTKKPVLTAYTSARTLKRAHPFQLSLKSANSIQAKAGEGDSGEFLGSIQRESGFSEPIVVTLEGLPKGYAAPSITVAADQSEFKLPVRFDAKAAAAELKNIRLVATYTPNPENKSLAVKSAPVAVTIQVVK